MDADTRGAIERATQRARKLLEEDFAAQLEGDFDVHRRGTVAAKAGSHLSVRQSFQRERIVAAIEHKRSSGMNAADAVADYLRDTAFTTLNRFVALKMLEGRELVQECITKGEHSSGYREFCGMAPGLPLLPDSAGYRCYIESLFDELSTGLKVLFNRRDFSSVLWPRRACFENLLRILNDSDLATVWDQDETIGWLYQYYNSSEERKSMREESATPRSSRELAVRNQFFTPRYVVEFLTDNTLGRLWYEMRRGQTAFKEQCRYLVRRPTELFLRPGETPPEAAKQDNLAQEELLQHPVYTAHRPLKDPRAIRLLDPACGSMHFGLYAFDLFTVIYDEAWEIVHGPDDAVKSTKTFAPFVTFAASFSDKAGFLREVPRFIIEHNLHGIDIDPRAVQIARLSLWLRAQRAWHQAGVKPADRPRIIRSNIVCAEPMPGEKELLREFVEQQFSAGERPAFAFLLEKTFDRMTLAGEAGSLLRIEEEIRAAIAEACALAQSQSAPQQARFFPGDEGPGQGEFDLRGLTDEQFWQVAEQRIYDALEAYAEEAENGGKFERRLFADDAAQGFAFIDLCRKRYDVVVMNPPFGGLPKSINVKTLGSKLVGVDDAYCLFADRAQSVAPDGLIGVISNSSFVLYESFAPYRSKLLTDWTLFVLVSLGDGVLDGAWVTTAAYVFGSQSRGAKAVIPFLDARMAEDKAATIASTIDALQRGVACRHATLHSPGKFSRIPGAPMCHWAPESLWRIAETNETVEMWIEDAGVGAAPVADFFRLRWEVPSDRVSFGKQWVPYANAGYFSPYYRDDYLVVDWEGNGKKPRADLRTRYPYLNGNVGIRIQRSKWFGNVGVTSGVRTDRFNVQLLPSGMLFGFNGLGIFGRQSVSPFLLLALLNTRFTAFYLNLITGLKKNDVYIRRVPVPRLTDAETADVARVGRRLYELARQAASVAETSNFFVVPVTLGVRGESIRDSVRRWRIADRDREIEFSRLLHESEQVVAGALGCDPALDVEVRADQGPSYWALPERSLAEGVDVRSSIRNASSTKRRGLFCRDDESSETDLALLSLGAGTRPDYAAAALMDYVADDELVRQTELLISYALGGAFGRWDIRLATGERPAPALPDPFAPLPVCPPGMLQGADGLPLSREAGRRLRTEGRYPLDVAWDGILVDDPEHPLDLERRVHAALAVLWGDRADALEHDACALLGVPTLREWFRRPAGFFADHLKRYSKSRRQAPIYWPLSTASGSYTLWLYYPRLAKDTPYRCLELVKEKLQHEEARLARLTAEFGASPDSRQRKELNAQEILVGDVRGFHEELSRVAPLWNPNLNDGVIINYAPLWRLIAHKPWQKTVKSCWDELVSRDYDWAHLSMHLWPECAVPKCASDQSFAIAHGLEDVFWVEGGGGKWMARKTPTRTVEELVRERTSPAVKAALKSLLEAPLAAGSGGRGRGGRRRAGASAAEGGSR